jgi:hypothetical protein
VAAAAAAAAAAVAAGLCMAEGRGAVGAGAVCCVVVGRRGGAGTGMQFGCNCTNGTKKCARERNIVERLYEH